MILIEARVLRWFILGISNHSSVERQHNLGEKSKRKYIILVQWILTYHKINIPHMYMCAYIYGCMLIAHVTQGYTWGLFFLLLSIFLQFSSETSHLIFWIMESVVDTATLQIGQRHTLYVNWELNLNFLKVWDVSIYVFFKRLYYSKIRASCKDWIHIQKHILKCIHFLVERSFKTCQLRTTLFLCAAWQFSYRSTLLFFWVI